MLFHLTWEFTDESEEGSRRSLAVFQAWQPPEGTEFKGFYGFADGGGGVAIIEALAAPQRHIDPPDRGVCGDWVGSGRLSRLGEVAVWPRPAGFSGAPEVFESHNIIKR